MPFITPELLKAEKLQRVENQIERTFSKYKQTLINSTPNEDGTWRVGLRSLGLFSDEEMSMIKEGIESRLDQAGWAFIPTYGIFAYEIRPKSCLQ